MRLLPAKTRVDLALPKKPVSIRHRRVHSSLQREWGPKGAPVVLAERSKPLLRPKNETTNVRLSCVACREPEHSLECVGRSRPLRYCKPIRVGAQFAATSRN